MTHPEPDHRGPAVNSGGPSGAGWFIAGGLIVLVLVAIWLLTAGVFDRTTTGSINKPGEVNIRAPGVNVDGSQLTQPAPRAPSGG
ncbi:MAG: hypothetical protein KF849_04950 [Rhizobiaceae bacterium]|nr:hypothetical protein [Rhizobiaceae bacterium]